MSVIPSRRNLELKVEIPAAMFDAMLDRTRELACAPLEHLHQVDTYFVVTRGRLKLRELRSLEDPEVVRQAQLIAYARSNETGSRWSNYEVVIVAGDQAAEMLRSMLMTHDERVRIDKQRLVGLIGHTRVHLDRVAGLGTYIELETVIGSQDDAAATREHQEVIAALGLDHYPAVAGSYSDLALARQ